jgi:hypothetical protein
MGSGLSAYCKLVSRYKEHAARCIRCSVATAVSLPGLKTGVQPALPSDIMGNTLLAIASAVQSDVWPLDYPAWGASLGHHQLSRRHGCSLGMSCCLVVRSPEQSLVAGVQKSIPLPCEGEGASSIDIKGEELRNSV